MLAKRLLPAVVLVLLAAFAQSALATTHVNFTLSDPSYTYLGFMQELFIENQNLPEAASTLRIDIRDDLPGNQLLDSTRLTTNGLGGFTQSFWSDMTLTQNGTNDWSAAGTVSFTDNDTSSQAFDALFQSTSVWLSGSSENGYRLGITGNLSPREGQGTMLVNRG